MIRKFSLGIALFSIMISSSFAQLKAPLACGPVPTENQMRVQEMEAYAFVHFSLNTYTDQSWGFGNEDVKLFNPQKADCRQWARICKASGMLYNDNEKLYMAVREPEPRALEIKETWWSVYPTWESWTWPGFEGKNIQVEVYSKYPKVRLYINNKLIGEQATTVDQQFKATFTVPYSAGVLKAVGIENGKEVESTLLKTAGEATTIKLMADRKEMTANGQDLIFVTVEIMDKNAVIQPNANNRLTIQVEGEGTIAGVGNADIRDTDPYAGNTRKAWGSSSYT